MVNIVALVIDHDPFPNVLRRWAASAGICLEVHISRTYTDALDWTYLSDEIDVVFVGYNFRNGGNAVDSFLVWHYVQAGFGGKEGKPLIAFSRDPEDDEKLLSAGCNMVCNEGSIAEFFFRNFYKEEKV